ncbi:MAG: aminoglycoside phosphotransferase family protein [Pelagibaca sp.]
MSMDAFLAAQGWADAEQEPLAGDASSRRYIRLCSGPKRAILMIDPQDDTARFATLSAQLNRLGLSAPDIYAQATGLMLLEDFGDAQFAKVAQAQPKMEIPLYQAATDVLCHLETCKVPDGLTHATPQILGQMVEPVFTHYLPLLGGLPDDTASEITARLTNLLDHHLPEETVLVLRDYHAENMIWLPDRDHIRRVGLLDFQDALAGPPVYDLVSLLQDARRDVTEACHDATLRHYFDLSGRSETSVMPAFHLLGLQRNLRILGIFARLATERGKPSYLALIPRVWAHIQTSLSSPVARNLEPLIRDLFPEPTPERLGVGAVP